MHRRQFLQAAAACGTLALVGCGGGGSDSGLVPVTDAPQVGASPSSGLPAAQLQATLDGRVTDRGVPGVVLAVDSPRGTFAGAAGKASLGGQAMTVQTAIRLASTTKTMTSTLVMRLQEEGLLRISDTLGQWLPDVVPNASIITVEQLLNHTAGVYDHENDLGFDNLKPDTFGRDWTPDEILSFARKHGPDFAPGTKWAYSNTGYYLLGMLIERVTGGTVEAAMRSRLFAPLGLTRTVLRRNGALTAPYTGGYCLTTDGRYLDMTGWNMSWDFTAGGASSVALEMVAWGKALFGGRVVSPATLAAMTTPKGAAAELRPGIGMGYGVDCYKSDRYLHDLCWCHAGMNGGTHVEWRHYPNRNLTVFAGINRADYATSGINALAFMADLLTQVMPLVG